MLHQASGIRHLALHLQAVCGISGMCSKTQCEEDHTQEASCSCGACILSASQQALPQAMKSWCTGALRC